MSTETLSRDVTVEPLTGVSPPSLATALERLRSLPDTAGRVRDDLSSAVRCFCRVMGKDPASLPAHLPTLRRYAKDAVPAGIGISRGRWRNILSGLKRALDLTHCRVTARQLRGPLSPSWQLLLSNFRNRFARIVFGRLARFCSSLGIEPSQVDDSVIHKFRGASEAETLLKDPNRVVGQVCRAWNRAMQSVPGWPQIRLSVPEDPRRYALSWSDFPPTLRQEVEAYHRRSLKPDLLDPSSPRPVQPSTVKQRDQLLQRLATAQVKQGIPISSITGLGDLVKPANLREGLRFLMDRAAKSDLDRDRPVPNQVEAIAQLACSIARHVVKLPEADLVELDRLRKHVRRKREGMTAKNRERLGKLEGETNIQSLLNLPARLARRADGGPVTRRSALLFQTAVAIELLIVTVIRVGNLCRLSYQHNFMWVQQRRERALHLIIPKAEVKNRVDLECPLPPESAALLERYMSRYQPLLAQGNGTDALFPGRNGNPKRQNGFYVQITKAVMRETGLLINPHLFRHFCARLHLNDRPGEYETVRRVLGHLSIKTTMDSYVGLETPAAVRHFDETILRQRTDRYTPPRRQR